ncbi:hypothetical protein [Falsirhodobacter sp. alg1]|uniref:hypothetical protein n=1 Tax=Falsirhodobacter sp. alg1 TaxID=1472418 RepID=UPI00178CD0F0|nr:hypothetical protein [Falsirhodobacter sp. alg1]
MTSVTPSETQTPDTPPRGSLPEAPLAMPKQVLTRESGFSLRKLFLPLMSRAGN